MKNKPKPSPGRQLTFQTRLERISEEMEYYAVSVPLKITQALRTKGPVPVMARINHSEAFLASLYPIGGGRHSLRVKNKICKAEGIAAGDCVNVQVTVRDRTREISIPKDVLTALRAEGVVEEFKALPIGKKSFLLRLIDGAARPETREKRIQEAIQEAQSRRERDVDRKGKGA